MRAKAACSGAYLPPSPKPVSPFRGPTSALSLPRNAANLSLCRRSAGFQAPFPNLCLPSSEEWIWTSPSSALFQPPDEPRHPFRRNLDLLQRRRETTSHETFAALAKSASRHARHFLLLQKSRRKFFRVQPG